ncbi:hypothetical protein Tco_1454029, partial [Tanacetum coccineum]
MKFHPISHIHLRPKDIIIPHPPEDDSEDGDDDSMYVDEEPSHFTRSTRQCDVRSSRARKGKGLAQTPVSSRPSKPFVLEDEDDMDEDIGVSCDEADEPLLEFDD